MTRNFYTCSREQLAALEKVGGATADKLLDLRDEAIAGLKVEYWQDLIEKNTDNTEVLQSQINSLETGINKQLLPIEAQMEDLAQSQLNERTRRLTFESEIDKKLQDIYIREEQHSNKRINSLAQQLNTALDKISCAQDRISEIENAQRFQRELSQSVDPHFLPDHDTKPVDRKPAGYQKPSGESIADIMQRIKRAWPKDNIYSRG